MVLVIILLCVMLAAALSGHFSGDVWYQQMRQPAWNPAPLFMALGWSMYYLAMAVAAWQCWLRAQRHAFGLLLPWMLLLALNVIWAWVFFGLHRVGWSQAVAGLWLAATLATAWDFGARSPAALRLLLLAGVWLGFVLALNFAQWSLNGGGVMSIFRQLRL